MCSRVQLVWYDATGNNLDWHRFPQACWFYYDCILTWFFFLSHHGRRCIFRSFVWFAQPILFIVKAVWQQNECNGNNSLMSVYGRDMDVGARGRVGEGGSFTQSPMYTHWCPFAADSRICKAICMDNEIRVQRDRTETDGTSPGGCCMQSFVRRANMIVCCCVFYKQWPWPGIWLPMPLVGSECCFARFERTRINGDDDAPFHPFSISAISAFILILLQM